MKYLVVYGDPSRDLEIVEARDADTAAREWLEGHEQHESIDVYPLTAGGRFLWARLIERRAIPDEAKK